MPRLNIYILRALPSLVIAIAASTLGYHRPAVAIDLQGSEIAIELELPNGDGEFALTTDQERIRDYFNLANCTCEDEFFRVRFRLENQAPSYESEPVEVWVGDSCDVAPDQIEIRNNACVMVEGFADIEDLRAVSRRDISVHDLVAGASASCPQDEDESAVFALIDENTRGIDGEDYSAPPLQIPTDTMPPPQVEEINVDGGENAIQIGWTAPTSRADDLRFVQVLCARASGEAATDANEFATHNPKYWTTQMTVCNNDADGVHPIPTSVDNGSPSLSDGGLTDTELPSSLFDLDPESICGEAAGTETNVRVGGLENGVAYRIVLVMIDEARNATALDLGTHTPQPVKDAWEYYQELGGNADGGYCFVATATFGNYDHAFVRILRDFRDNTLAHTSWGRRFISWYYDNSPQLAAFISAHPVARGISYLLLAPLVALAAFVEYIPFTGKLLIFAVFIILAHRYRSRGTAPISVRIQPLADPIQLRPKTDKRRVLVGMLAMFVILGFCATAHTQPYWDELNEDIAPSESRSRWNIELKLGPYYPNIDDELESATPFRDVFGSKKKIMTILGLDRFFYIPTGQLGVTASVGFSRRQANAFRVDSMGNTIEENGSLLRSSGDKTKFRVFPTSLGAVYRFTTLDHALGVPLIPYGKVALSYYWWRFTSPDGSTSEAPSADCPIPGSPAPDGTTCTGNRGRGGSLGYQATLGIALRAERLDPSAALSLRNDLGIEHAGFFVEAQWAVVDGFGAEKKLSVGDTNWFGGINFEF